MNVLVLGSGAREHALGRRLIQSESVRHVYISPGNAGIDAEAGLSAEPGPLSLERIDQLDAAVVVAGPGVEATDPAHVPTFEGKNRLLASCGEVERLERDRLFAKEVMLQIGIPTPRFQGAEEAAVAHRMVDEMGHAVAVKANTSVAGRSIYVCTNPAEGHAAVARLDAKSAFATSTILLEEVLQGTEVSITVLTNGKEYTLLPTAEIFSRGAGAVSPHPNIDAAEVKLIEREIVRPTIDYLGLQNWACRGFLTFRIIVAEHGPYLLEYVAGLGEPEAQVILPLVDGDVGALLADATDGTISPVSFRSGFACGVVAFSSLHHHGDELAGAVSDANPRAAVRPLYGAVRAAGKGLATSGARVGTVVGIGDTLEEARSAAYGRLLALSFAGLRYRSDIGGASLVSDILEEGGDFLPQFTRRGGLLPVVVQEADTKDVLMVGYANLEAFHTTRETGRATFFSTSRGTLWTKGETSGNWLEMVETRIDCDQDAVLYLVRLHGHGVCHTTDSTGKPRRSCFFRTVNADVSLTMIE